MSGRYSPGLLRVLAVSAVTLIGAGACSSPEVTVTELPPPPAAAAAPIATTARVDTAPAPDQAEYTMDEFETREALVAPRAAGARRVTNHRISFDAAGRADDSAYRELYDHYLVLHAETLSDIATHANHHDLLAPQDEFEPNATYDARLQQWVDVADRMFRDRMAYTEWEIFGIPVAPATVSYDANVGVLRLAYPPLPRIADLLGSDYRTRYVKRTENPAAVRATPLLKDFSLISPLDCTLQQDVFGPIPVPDVERARELKAALTTAPAFVYIRFRPEVRKQVWDDYGAFVGSTRRQMRILSRIDFQVFLRVTQMVLYAPDGRVLAVTRLDRSRPANLWFLRDSAAGVDAAAGDTAARPPEAP